MISDHLSNDIPPQMENLKMDIPILMHFCSCKPYKASRHPMKCGVINDIKLFATVYCRIYCRKFLTLSNQTSNYKSKCIRMSNNIAYLKILFLFLKLNILCGYFQEMSH